MGREAYSCDAGLPTDDSRATLVVSGPNQSNAVYGPCDNCDYVAVRNIQVDGQRESLGYLAGGIGLLEMGGMTTGQVRRLSRLGVASVV